MIIVFEVWEEEEVCDDSTDDDVDEGDDGCDCDILVSSSVSIYEYDVFVSQ
jgi:hypothetical protein